ncbi:hypothetical protein J4440_03355 [Candidatus Woesearchaeota archaeon]|nr:hypothetical protein [Candidatus Woesearchaeota archaeon]
MVETEYHWAKRLISNLDVPGLTKLVSLEAGYSHGISYSQEWGQLSVEQRGEKLQYDRQYVHLHTQRYLFTKVLSTQSGEFPRIVRAYTPMNVKLVPSLEMKESEDEERHLKLKERIEEVIQKNALRIKRRLYAKSASWREKPNAYSVNDLEVVYLLPESVIGSFPSPTDPLIYDRPIRELLFPRWAFTLTFYEIEGEKF